MPGSAVLYYSCPQPPPNGTITYQTLTSAEIAGKIPQFGISVLVGNDLADSPSASSGALLFIGGLLEDSSVYGFQAVGLQMRALDENPVTYNTYSDNPQPGPAGLGDGVADIAANPRDPFLITAGGAVGPISVTNFAGGTPFTEGQLNIHSTTVIIGDIDEGFYPQGEWQGFVLAGGTFGCTNGRAGGFHTGTGTTPVNVTAGFSYLVPDIVILFGSGWAAEAGNPPLTYDELDISTIGIGVCVNNEALTQKGVTWIEANGSAGAPRQHISTNACGLAQSHSANALRFKGAITAFDPLGSGGFQFTPSLNSDVFDRRFSYLALKLNTGSVSVIELATPGSTGHHSFTGVGFTPESVLIIGTGGTVWDSSVNTALAGGLGISAFTEGSQRAAACRMDYLTTQSGSIISESALHWARGNNISAAKATFVSMDEDGFTLNFQSTVAGLVGFAICFGPDNCGIDPPVSSSQSKTKIWGDWP